MEAFRLHTFSYMLLSSVILDRSGIRGDGSTLVLLNGCVSTAHSPELLLPLFSLYHATHVLKCANVHMTSFYLPLFFLLSLFYLPCRPSPYLTPIAGSFSSSPPGFCSSSLACSSCLGETTICSVPPPMGGGV